MPSPPDKHPEQWASFNPPIGLEQKRATATLTTLTLKQGISWSGGDYNIVDSDGKTIFTCKGKVDMHMRKDLYDEHGELLFHFDTEPNSIHRKTSVTDEVGNELFFVRKSKEDWPNLSVEFVDDATEKPMELVFDGQYFKDKGLIKKGELPVAQVWREKILAMTTRTITIAPGVDVALVVGVMIIFDMIQMEHASNMGLAVPHKKKGKDGNEEVTQ